MDYTSPSSSFDIESQYSESESQAYSSIEVSGLLNNQEDNSISLEESDFSNIANIVKNSLESSKEDFKGNGGYLFKNNLFNRTLQPAIPGKERQYLVCCQLCSYKKYENAVGFKASNFVRHIEVKHKEYPINKQQESYKRKNNLSFRAISSPSFQELLDFYNKFSLPS
ncbi:hypothetical protein BKA59DRAFT_521036 [Fusarium tricinctum]|uniref:Uncharacterized protein n=1 Tax=Fusarium tricinctum TaxID=61284 RepID=A0A8K0S436_9HYPO|nr:hypothetical protein BKA59DRAFT_521036 [Fusarium tricinctum]